MQRNGAVGYSSAQGYRVTDSQGVHYFSTFDHLLIAVKEIAKQ
jgi:hypothetical protein